MEPESNQVNQHKTGSEQLERALDQQRYVGVELHGGKKSAQYQEYKEGHTEGEQSIPGGFSPAILEREAKGQCHHEYPCMGKDFLEQHPKKKNKQSGNPGHVDPLPEAASLDDVDILLEQADSFTVTVENQSSKFAIRYRFSLNTKN